MSNVSYEVHENAQQLFVAAADLISRLSAEAISERGQFLLALSGGSTPRGLYQVLAQAPYRDRIEWSQVQFFWGDERTVPADHADSNYGMAQFNLLRPLGIEERAIHRIEGENPDPAIAAQKAMQRLATVANWQGGPLPTLDLVLLGLGSDAHTASLFPETDGLREERAWFMANPVPQQASTRITMTFPLINAAANVAFLVAGEDKAEAIARVWGQTPTDAAPASRVQPTSGRLTWFADEAAASEVDVQKLSNSQTEHSRE